MGSIQIVLASLGVPIVTMVIGLLALRQKSEMAHVAQVEKRLEMIEEEMAELKVKLNYCEAAREALIADNLRLMRRVLGLPAEKE